MNREKNPFSPGAGTQPPELAGRQSILDGAELALARVAQGRSEKSLILVGLRGVGKTVLLDRFRRLAGNAGYKVAMIEATGDKPLPLLLAPQLRRIMLDLNTAERIGTKVKQGFRVLKSFFSGLEAKYGEFSMSIEGEDETGAADSGDLESDLTSVFLAMGEAAQEKRSAIAIIVDELQYLADKELSALIMALHSVAQRQLPLVFFGAGLPQVVASAGRSKSYAERLFRFPAIGALNAADSFIALQAPVKHLGVSFTQAALEQIAANTKGYPYFLQEWGYEAWNAAGQSPIDVDVVNRASAETILRLDESFFRVRFDRLTPRERDYLRALAELGNEPQRSGAIAQLLGLTSEEAGPLRDGLIKKGMLYSPQHGQTGFTVPLFDEFMKRTMPAPAKKVRRVSSKRKSGP